MDSTPTTPPDSDSEIPFGAAVLQAIREAGLGNIRLDYATIQKLKVADRAETIRILRSASANMPYATIQRLKKDSPEQIAQHFFIQYQLAAQAAANLPVHWMMFTM